MLSLYTFASPPGPCGYLPDRNWSLRYEIVASMTAEEYGERLDAGWRRFGHALFRPECPSCVACRSLRVDVARFRPNQSQKRAWKANLGTVTLTVGEPEVTAEKLELYDRFHAFQVDFKGWPERGPKDAADYADSYVTNPFPSEEWCYRVDGRLVGVGYVDAVPRGLSAIYFFYDPDERSRSLGVFNVQSVIASARQRGMPFAYLGYHVPGCRSLEYKATYRPHELRDADGNWHESVD